MQLTVETVASLMRNVTGKPFLQQIDNMLVGNLAFEHVWCRIVLQPIKHTDTQVQAVYPNLDIKLIPVWKDCRVLNFASLDTSKLERIVGNLQAALNTTELVLAQYPSKSPIVTINFCNTISLLVGQAADPKVNQQYLNQSLHQQIMEYLFVAELLQMIARGEYTSPERVQAALIQTEWPPRPFTD